MPQNKTLDSLSKTDLSKTDTSFAPSLFQEHQLQVKEPQPVIHYTQYDYLAALILFLSFSMFVWIYVAHSKRLNALIKDFYRSRQGNRPSQEEYSVSNRVGFSLSVLFLLTMSLFIGQVIEYYGLKVKVGETGLYFAIIIALICMYLTKIALVRFSGFVFKAGKEAAEYTSAMFVFINMLGLFMLPVVICLSFIRQLDPKVFIYTGYFLIGSFLCLRLIKGLVIGFGSSRVSKFYLFLYLCTLEIIPFIILIKLFMLYIA